MQDIRRALRIFRLEPGFAAAAILTLALGIGANTALFAVVETVLLKPLPVEGAGELVILKHRDRASGATKEFIALGDYIDLKARQTSLDLSAYGGGINTLFGDHEPMRVRMLSATPDLMTTMKLQPVVGRVLTADDARQGAPPVAMIGYDLWQRVYGSDPAITTRSIQIGTTKRLVVGVAPRGFHFPPDSSTDAIVPLALPAAAPAARKSGWLFAVGRLRPGQSKESALAEYDTISQQLEREFPEQNQRSQYFVEPLRDALVGDTKRPLLLMLGAVGFVLLIACANVGNLLLARSLARQHEMSVRIALGAGRGRLALQIFAEALVLALTGGLVGVAVAWQITPALASMIPDTTRIPGLDAVGVNPAVLAFSFLVSIVSALVFSAIACVSLRGGERRALAASSRRTTTGVAARRAASALVIGEIALAGVLLIGAGLTLRSFANLLAVDPGFRMQNVLTMQVILPAARYPKPESRIDFYNRAFAALESLDEVEQAGAAAVTPLTGNNWTVPFDRVDKPVPKGQRAPDVGWQGATGGYFAALAIPLKSGRWFDARDIGPKSPSVVISEAIAQKFFPDEDPIGHRVNAGGPDGSEIIGVVGNIRRASLTDEPHADMYFPFIPEASSTLFLHTKGAPMSALPAVRTALKALEPNLIIEEVRTFDDVAAASAAVTRLAMRLLGGFAFVALALAAIGIYGVLAYSVRQRTRELGTRVALGAGHADIIRLVMKEGGAITLAGLILAVVIGLVAARSLGAVLYGVPPSDPLALGLAAAVLGATAVIACFIPARRAAQIDPARTLTND